MRVYICVGVNVASCACVYLCVFVCTWSCLWAGCLIIKDTGMNESYYISGYYSIKRTCLWCIVMCVAYCVRLSLSVYKYVDMLLLI